jgi:manganese transport protein
MTDRSKSSSGEELDSGDVSVVGWRRVLRSIGPALIVACVVLGPGSILTSSQIGCQYGFQLLWVLVAAGMLMVAAVAAAARLGVALTRSPCSELAHRVGRPAAAVTGLSVFCIAACFQFSNNLGVLASIEPLIDVAPTTRVFLLLALNGLLVMCLFGMERLYRPLEKLMMVMVGLMLVGFAANLFFARPAIGEMIRGLVPSLPADLTGEWLPRLVEGESGSRQILDPWLVVQGLIVTTFSIAGAFYQAYLVKEKGWTSADLKEGVVDSAVGTFVLVGISVLIMATSASVLAGRVDPGQLKSAADVARQLEPLFGAASKWLFCIGIFAGALSSFLVNSMIGGTLLADGLGFDAALDSRAVKIGTTAVLFVGMAVALMTSPESRVPLIIFAQAMTVLGGPLLVCALGYLLFCLRKEQHLPVPVWMGLLLGLGTVTVVVLAIRTAWRLSLTLRI